MNRFLLTAASFAALSAAGPVSAADLPVRSSAPAFAAPIFTWAGLYAGVNAGYIFSTNNSVTTTGQVLANVNNVNGGARPASVSLNQGGFIGGTIMGKIGSDTSSAISVESNRIVLRERPHRDKLLVGQREAMARRGQDNELGYLAQEHL